MKLTDVVQNCVTVADMKTLVGMLKAKAVAGNVDAAMFLLSCCDGKARKTPSQSPQDRPRIGRKAIQRP